MVELLRIIDNIKMEELLKLISDGFISIGIDNLIDTGNSNKEVYESLIRLSLQGLVSQKIIIWKPDKYEFEELTSIINSSNSWGFLLNHINAIKSYELFYNDEIPINGDILSSEAPLFYSNLPSSYKSNFKHTKIPVSYIRFQSKGDFETNLSIFNLLNNY